ncbi:hypothetical protein GE061_010956 [Apolygus lucorum]|uniref:HTH psq-type domain-containing protein n=1 Tax=Apolygus lucorum TaxID=248454 RepID=A0A8S9XXH7_APOLU|nr:hypothetical protein GE061_010956 [Apolygus lucorum]
MPGKRNTRFAETEDAEQENGSNDTDGTGKVSSKGNKVMKYSFETLQKALQLIKDGQISISEAARSFGIAKSTLHTKLTGKRPLVTKMGPATYLTAEEENEIKSWILNKAKLGFPLCREDVKDSIQNVLASDAVGRDAIKNGFRACGLFPLDENAIDYTKCISERRAEIERKTEYNQNETPTTEDLSTTRRVFEYYLRDNGRETFLVHLKEGTCPEDENEQMMFLLWKKCLPQSLLSDSSFNSLDENVHSLHSRNSSDPEDPHSVTSLDIMSMPIELQEDWNLNLSDSDPYSGLLKEFDLISDRISGEVEIVGNERTNNNNIPIIDISNQHASQGGEEEERCDEHSPHLDVIENNNSSAISDDVNTNFPVVDSSHNFPEQPDAEAANVVESAGSSSKLRETPLASTSWDAETARLKSLWSEELTLPNPQKEKTSKDLCLKCQEIHQRSGRLADFIPSDCKSIEGIKNANLYTKL